MMQKKFFFGINLIYLMSCQTMPTSQKECDIVQNGKHWFAQCEQTKFQLMTFDNGADYLQEGLRRYVENNKIGFIDNYGNVVIKAKYDFAQPFVDGKTKACVNCIRKTDGEHSFFTGGDWFTIKR